MPRRNRHDSEDEENGDEITPEYMEQIELKAVVWYLRQHGRTFSLTKYVYLSYSSRWTKN